VVYLFDGTFSSLKDDANFKLMSERIKSNQINRLAREEKEMLTQQVATLSTQVGKLHQWFFVSSVPEPDLGPPGSGSYHI
jgi:hypothetical protein